MANRSTKTTLGMLLLVPAWLLAGICLWMAMISSWREAYSEAAQDRWNTAAAILWMLSLPIGWVLILRRGNRKAVEEQRSAAEARSNHMKVKSRLQSRPEPRDRDR